ncbi:MAG: ABC transporter permease [Agromyces sp.]
MTIDAQFFGSVLTTMTPLVLAALGALLCFRSGFFNIAIEGQMLVAAFAAAATAVATGNVVLAVTAGAAASVVLVAVIAIATYWAGVDAIVAGIAANLLAAGLTALLTREMTGGSSSIVVTDGRLPRVDAGSVAAWGVVGDLFRGQTPLVLVAFLAVPAVWWFLTRTRTGLGVRALGESELAVRSSGLSVTRVRLMTTLLCGVLCGLAGAQLSLGPATSFSVGMTNGRGFTAIIAAMIGTTVVAAVLGCALFGVVEALGLRIQLGDTGLPQVVVQAIPYLLALVVLSAASAVQQRRIDPVRRRVLRH